MRGSGPKAGGVKQPTYDTLVPGWRPDLERLIGLLLGYDQQDIERFIATLPPPRPV